MDETRSLAGVRLSDMISEFLLLHVANRVPIANHPSALTFHATDGTAVESLPTTPQGIVSQRAVPSSNSAAEGCWQKDMRL